MINTIATPRKGLLAVCTGIVWLFMTAQTSALFIDDFIVETSATESVQLDVVSQSVDSATHNSFAGSLIFGLSVDAGSSEISVNSSANSSITFIGPPKQFSEYTFNFSGAAGGGTGGSATIDMNVQYNYNVLIGVTVDMTFSGSDSVKILHTATAPGSLPQTIFQSSDSSGDFLSGFIGPGALSIIGELDLSVLAPASAGLRTLFSGSLNLDLEIAGVDPPAAIPGDLNGDGFVGIDDLNIILGSWNQTVPPGNPLADPSGDGFVGIDDLNMVLAPWNTGTPPTVEAVPEPATLGLVGLPLVLFSRCRTRN